MKKCIYLISITLVSLVACTRTQELDIPDIQEDGFTIIAKTEAPAETRTTVESGVHVFWEPGDEIAVFSGDKRGRFATDLTTTSGTAAFKDVQGDGSWSEVNDLWALYPYSEGAAFDGETITTVLPWRQVAREDSFGKDMNIAIAHNPSGNTLQFYNVGGGIRFSLSKEGIKEVELVGQKGEILAGNIKIGFHDGVPTILDITDGQPWVVVTPPNGETFKKDTWYYIITVPQVFENGFYLEFRNGNQYNDCFFDNSIVIKRSIYGSITHAESIHEKQLALEREALIDLYNATDGDHWNNNTNWCSDLPVGQWYGVSTDVNGRVTRLDLSAKGLNGTIPESIGNLVNLNYLNLGWNDDLGGSIPESIGNLVNLTHLAFTQCKMTGTIPESIMNLTKLNEFGIYLNHFDGTISEKLYYSDWWITRYFRMDQRNGYALKFENIYESTDFSRNGEIKTLQKHSKGPGFPIVVTADGYSDRMIADGYFDTVVDISIEAFFAEEPYKSFRDYFDVYSIVAVSKNELIAYDLAFESTFSSWGPSDGITINAGKVNEFIKQVPGVEDALSSAIGLLLVNKNNGCVGPFAYMYDDEYALAVVGAGERDAVPHEAGGHGFGKLVDEYYSPSRISEEDIHEAYHKRDWFLNADDTNDPTQVIWKDFLNDPFYQEEGIGIYQGAYYGDWYKSSRQSIMNGMTNGFNAPSRWAIYKRIKKLAGEEYSFEDFLAYDKNRKKNLVERHPYRIDNGKNEKPPMIIHAPSNEAGIHQ